MLDRLRRFLAAVWSQASRLRRGSDQRAAVGLGLASLLGPAGGFIANIVYARTLGADGRGELASVIAALALCEAVLVLGFPDVLTRLVAKRSVDTRVLRGVLVIAAGVSVLAAVGVFLWAVRSGFNPYSSMVAAVSVPIATAAAIGRGVLTGRRMFRRLMWVLVFGGVTRLVSPMLLIAANQKEPDLALMLVAASTIIASIPVFTSLPFRESSTQDARSLKRVFREALALWPANLAWSLNTRLDQLLLALFLPPSQLGLYAVCVVIAELPIVLSSGLRQVVLVRSSEEGDPRLVKRIASVIIVAGAAGSALALIVGGPFMGWVFGSEFSGVANVLAIMIMGSAFIISAGLLDSYLIAQGKSRYVAVAQGAGLVVAIPTLLLALTFGGGIVAAALTSSMGYLVIFLMARIFVRRSQIGYSNGD